MASSASASSSSSSDRPVMNESESHLAAVERARSAASARAEAMAAASSKDEAWYSMCEVDLSPHTVLVERLPMAICNNEEAVKAMLQQAGLKHFLVDFQVTKVGKGKKATGSLRVTLVNEHIAYYCVQHFLGCCWASTSKGASGLAARILTEDELRCEAEAEKEKAGQEEAATKPKKEGKKAQKLKSCPGGEKESKGGAERTPSSDSEQSTRAQSERVLASDGSDDDSGTNATRARLNWADLCEDDKDD